MTEQIPDEIAKAPAGYVVFDEAGCIIACNNAALAMGLQPGMQRNECLTGTGDACQLITTGASKPVRISIIDEKHIWVEDISEVTVLTRQLQKLKRPLNQELRHVNHQATTGLGYAELLSVILDEELGIPPEKQKALQLYQGELVKTLRAIRAVLSGAGDNEPQGTGKDGEILVTDKQPELAELIAELLKTRGYKSVSFTDAESVMKYLHLNRDKASLALVDDTLLAGDEPLDAVMQKEFEHLQVIRLSTGAEPENEGRLHLVKPLDFEALFKAVEGLVGGSVHGS